MGNATGRRRHLQCNRVRVKYLVAHGMNDPRGVASVLRDGANGIEIDVYSDDTAWYVNHDAAEGLTIARYMEELTATARDIPRLIYLDIKTPRARNLEALGDLVRQHPAILFLYGTNKDVDQLLRLPRSATLAVDMAWTTVPLAEVAELMRTRNFWLGDGNIPGMPKPSMWLGDSPTAFRAAHPVGVFAWTYSTLDTFQADITRHQLDMVTVLPSLVRDAARLLCSCPRCLSGHDGPRG